MSTSSHSFRASVDILEELQLIAAQNLEKLDMDKYYEVVCELGKGTYGKVDLVVHKIRGEPQLAAAPLEPQQCDLFFKNIPLSTDFAGKSSLDPFQPKSTLRR